MWGSKEDAAVIMGDLRVLQGLSVCTRGTVKLQNEKAVCGIKGGLGDIITLVYKTEKKSL